MKKPKSQRKVIILTAVIVSIILYFTGVFSGLYANKIFEERTKENIENVREESKRDIWFIKSETEEELEDLRNYVDLLELNMKTMQLEQIFVETLSEEKICDFSSITIESLLNQLAYFWDKLPYRIEEFETQNELSEEYLQLKKQYTQHSIKTWIYVRNKHNLCKTTYIPILYFYSNQCEDCIKQGEELDGLKIQEKGKGVLVFTIDINSEDIMVRYIKEFYNVTQAPSLIIKDRVYEGFTGSKDLLGELEK